MQDKNKRILKIIGYSFVVMFILLAVTPVLAQPVEVVVNAPEYVEEGETFDATIDVGNMIDFWIGTEIRIGEGEGEEEEEEKEEEEKTLTPTPRPLSDSLAIPLEPGEYKLEFSVHPGDLVSKDLILTNGRDSPAYNISHTPVAGNASDMIRIKPEKIEEISPGDEEKLTITVSVPEDQELGNYTGYSYFFFSSTGFPPPIPIKIDFSVSVVPEEVKEIYGIDLKIDGQDEVAVKNVTSNETASFEITVKNTGMYFDVMQIEEPELEDSEGWNVKLYDEAKEVTTYPHDILINAEKEHYLMLNVTGTTPGTNLTVEITGRSSANVTKMDSVRSITYIKAEEVVNESYVRGETFVNLENWSKLEEMTKNE